MSTLSAAVAPIVAEIPSPGEWGRTYRLYGIMIAIGVLAALELARYRWANRGGNPEDMSSIALWAVPAGLIGARLYHVITDNQQYRGHWFDNPFGSGSSPLAFWHGGLGIPGGILCGVVVGVIVANKKGIRLAPALDAVAPCLPLAQAIGRWGNYFNVELFGSPTDLPWGLNVPLAQRPPGYEAFTTFHPTFLYEMLWNLGLVVFLILIDRKRVLRPGRLFALYIGGYFTGRLWVESLRIDEANKILGLRVNTWTSLLVMFAVALFLIIGGVKRREGDDDEPYRDGHRWEGHEVPATVDGGADADADASEDDVSDDDVSDVATDDATVTATASGTKARAARQRAGTSAGQRAKGGGAVDPKLE